MGMKFGGGGEEGGEQEGRDEITRMKCLNTHPNNSWKLWAFDRRHRSALGVPNRIGTTLESPVYLLSCQGTD
jgi:hypothetical protein